MANPQQPADEPDPGLATYPVALQRRLHERVAGMRAQLRAALAACSPALQQLAALDEALEHALVAREQLLLATLPGLFKSAQAPAPGGDASLPPSSPQSSPTPQTPPGTQTLQTLLQAELQARWQPVAGLLDALDEHLAAPPALAT